MNIKTVLINKWAYFQPAGDSGMNKRNGGNVGVGCNNNGNRLNGSNSFQRPIITCLNDSKDQHQSPQQQQHQQMQNHNYNANHMIQSQNQQQHQVIHFGRKIQLFL